MATILKKFRAVIFSIIALFLYAFGYQKAKENAQTEQIKGEHNAIQKAIKARHNLSNPDYVKCLHNKYKR